MHRARIYNNTDWIEFLVLDFSDDWVRIFYSVRCVIQFSVPCSHCQALSMMVRVTWHSFPFLSNHLAVATLTRIWMWSLWKSWPTMVWRDWCDWELDSDSDSVLDWDWDWELVSDFGLWLRFGDRGWEFKTHLSLLFSFIGPYTANGGDEYIVIHNTKSTSVHRLLSSLTLMSSFSFCQVNLYDSSLPAPNNTWRVSGLGGILSEYSESLTVEFTLIVRWDLNYRIFDLDWDWDYSES